MNLQKRDFIIREPLLVGMLVLIAVAFSALTHAYSEAYDKHRASLSVEWFERAKLDLKNNRPSAAIEALRTALLYDPRNRDFTLYLAEALAQTGRSDQALNYYLGLWQSSPNNGPVNLRLARLSAQKGDAVGAERYFNGAIFGDWPENPAANRRMASLELIDFYLNHGDTGHAESQLIILSDNLPEDPLLHIRVAKLYSRIGQDQRALNQYRQAIQLDPNDLQAMRGAAEASFHTGDYRAAQAYASRTLHLDESDSSAKRLLAVIQAIFSLNPYEHGITEAKKIKRTLQSFDIAGNRLQSCSGSGHSSMASSIDPFSERWKQLKVVANDGFLRQHPEEVDTLFDFSSSAEKIAESNCGDLKPEDSALLAIATQHAGEAR